jgi:hypothetical protein
MRKNRRETGCKDNVETGDGNGIDLNRNYDFKWALNEIGSSGNKC